LSCFACSIFLKQPFSASQKLAAGISFIGVVFIARPFNLFVTGDSDETDTISYIDSKERAIAVGFGIIGVFGVSSAWTTIRAIGKRVAPEVIVIYFSVWGALGSGIALWLTPSATFRLPSSPTQLFFLILIGFSGFAEQFLLTAGLAYEKNSRATNVAYAQILFSLLLDKLVWNITPGLWSCFGGALILGSVIYAAIVTEKASVEAGDEEKPLDGEEIEPLNNVDDGSKHEDDYDEASALAWNRN
jgi:drug/metabolite transporter (DMT)-like permease